MNNSALLRSLIVFAVCVPLAIFVGYQLTDPLTSSTFYVVALLGLGLASPLLFRWHHFLLFSSWYFVAVLFFVPGMPPLWMLMVMVSLVLSVVERATNKNMRFLSVPQVTWPLLCLAIVVLVTAKFTGGIGIRSFGGDVYGGKRYIYVLGAILGYFAMTAHRIPTERAWLYVATFFLSGLTGLIGDFFSLVGPSMYFIFYVFPPNLVGLREGFVEVGTTRLGGTVSLAFAVFFYILARHGVRGVLDFGRPWRLVILVCFSALGLLGGFRYVVVILTLTFLVQFFLEGLHKTKLLPALILCGLLVGVVVVPFASKLPHAVQRALAVFPFLKLDPLPRMDAEASSEWRVQMWKAVLPEIPQYLLLGKGYALSTQDFDMMNVRRGSDFAENWDSALAGDYHNGPLSVILPFGIWGVIAFLWFIVAALRVLTANYRHGLPGLRKYNTLLLAVFISRTIVFFLLGGGLNTDMWMFVGYLGLSVSLNGGVCRRSQATVAEVKGVELTTAFPRARPAFQR